MPGSSWADRARAPRTASATLVSPVPLPPATRGQAIDAPTPTAHTGLSQSLLERWLDSGTPGAGGIAYTSG
ncbi:hypothetical protein GCM10010168_47430 [Actinoplanes ianthinogenes]|uniref:Uncharacterized protein n=1 Tax=Actinoplanes ianthinogenes TaxID=122358 RepID=A0ABM7LNV0_9ACTN|nr:hypothetical protein Aiant_16150 [Actinoplanes ianthinogenes]GGR23929.1 hypothetical protein GCM10010168_47430 [Actinoplanes ianthinogenes]